MLKPLGRGCPMRNIGPVDRSHQAGHRIYTLLRNVPMIRAQIGCIVVVVAFASHIPVKADDSRDASIAKGIEFLLRRGQDDQGAFSPQSGTGVTSLCVAAILENRPEAVSLPGVKKAISFLEQNFRPNGGIYVNDSTHRNYETCIAIQALTAANRDGRYDKRLAQAEKFLRGLQWDEGEGIETSDTQYGGAGYGRHGRPDMSNTTFFIDALKSLGRGEDDPAITKALQFVSRCQNLESPQNDTPFAAKIGDGGFYYTAAAGGESQAGKTADGGLRSYGSMTYAGLKSMIYAGVSKDDQRVKAALTFIQKTYSLEHNPGMGDAGLYYYYHTFAKALAALDETTVIDAQGVEHDWRTELIQTLAASQQADGAWVNHDNQRWLEGDRNLVTAYALLALHYCQ